MYLPMAYQVRNLDHFLKFPLTRFNFQFHHFTVITQKQKYMLTSIYLITCKNFYLHKFYIILTNKKITQLFIETSVMYYGLIMILNVH